MYQRLQRLNGYDGIAIANQKGVNFHLSTRDLYLEFVKDVKTDINGKTKPNPYKMDRNKSNISRLTYCLRAPPTSGTRDALNELGIERVVKLIQKNLKKVIKII